MPEATEQGAVIVLSDAADPLCARVGRLVGSRLRVAADVEQLVELLERTPTSLVLVDLRHTSETWSKLARAVIGPAVAGGSIAAPALVVVGDEDHWPRVAEALADGAVDCVRLPIDDVELGARLRSSTAALIARLDERHVLGEAIHSDSLQVLAALTMRLQLVQRRADHTDAALDVELGHELGEIIDELSGALERLRSLDFGLRRGERELLARGATATMASSTSPTRTIAPTSSSTSPATSGAARSAIPSAAAPRVDRASVWETPELLSRLSHDLRSPLNAVLGFAQLLELGDLTPEQTDATRQIMRAGTRLLELVNEVVDLSRIEFGHLPVSLEPVELHGVVRDAIDLLRPAALDSEVVVIATGLAAEGSEDGQIEPDPGMVLADRQRLLQVLLILLSNAVRYNQPGGRVELAGEREGGRVRISVTDNGIGISPEQLDKVFVPFDRLGVDKQGIDGTGLGLPIARGLVARMGGDITVASSLGEGATFSFDLRVAPVAVEAVDDSAADEHDEAASSTFEVLYIEDNPASLRLVERILSRRPGVTLIPAMQGRLGMQLAVQRRPSMVLVDLHLPDMSGLDVVRALAAEPATKDLPVVVLSADAERQQSERAVAEGARAYLSKPFQIESLLAMVDAVRREIDDESEEGGS